MSNKNNNKVYMNNPKKSDLFAEILKLYWEILKKILIKIIILYKRVNVNIQCSLSPLTYKFWQYNKYGKKSHWQNDHKTEKWGKSRKFMKSVRSM